MLSVVTDLTSTYFLKDGLKLNIDQRFNERTNGYIDKEKYPNFFCDQYYDRYCRERNPSNIDRAMPSGQEIS